MTTVYIYSVFCVVCFLCFVVLLLEKDVVKMADEKRIEFVCITVLGVREMREICTRCFTVWVLMLTPWRK